jgi:hypothetical protein
MQTLPLPHYPTQHRFALLLEMQTLPLPHCPTQNRFALLLEMLYTTAHKTVRDDVFPFFAAKSNPIPSGMF